MKGAGDQDPKRRPPHGRHQGRIAPVGQTDQQQGGEGRHQGAHQPAYAGEMRGAGAQHVRAKTDPVGQPAGDRNAGEELDGQQVMADETGHRVIGSSVEALAPSPHAGRGLR